MPDYSIGEEFLGELRRKCDIETVISKYVQLKKSSSSYVGLCPFHNEKTPSFHVDVAKQLFYCFGCHAGGDVITFIMKQENLSYVEAVKFLADMVGMQVPQRVSFDSEIGELRKRILEMNRIAARFYHEQLKSETGKHALDYLVGRQLTWKTIVGFGLGYSPDSWNSLYDHLRKNGYRDDEIVSSGLCSRSEKRIFDRFRDRVMFPIIDQRNNVIGFGARTMKSDEPAKYLNTSENIVFHKGSNLYAINSSKSSKDGYFILCEGYMDVIALHQAGLTSAVATLGTALTQDQAFFIKKFTDSVVLCYDSDAPGKQATSRAIPILKNAGLNVRVISVPGSKDPDEFIKTYGGDRFRQLISDSRNDTEYKLDEIRYRYNIDIDSEKVSCVNDMIRVLSDIPNKAEREIYTNKVCRELELSKENVEAEIKKVVSRKQKQQEKEEEKKRLDRLKGTDDKVNPERAKYPKAAAVERDIISILVNYPEMCSHITSKLHPEDFVTDFNRRVYMVITEKLSDNPSSEPMNLLSETFSASEIGNIISFVSTSGAIKADKDTSDRLIEILKEEKNRILSDTFASSDDEAFAEAIKKLQKKK